MSESNPSQFNLTRPTAAVFAAFFSRPSRMKAGDGNRTHVACLEGRYSTIELHPRFRPPRRPLSVRDPSQPPRGSSGCLLRLSRSRADRFLTSISSGSLCVPVECDRARHIRLPDPTQSQSTWVEQDSNLRRHCHQIYSLAPLAAWVSTPNGTAPHAFAPEEPEKQLQFKHPAELAVGLELTTLGLQNRCSTG